MAHQTATLSGRAPQFAAICLTAGLLAGCAGMTQTTTSVRALPEPPSLHVHLTRAGVIPITGTFRQEGHAVIGQLAFSNDCASESRQVVRRQETTDTHSNRATATGLAIVGGIVTAVGVGLIAASADADEQVSCGEGKAGDRCMSESSALQEVGLTTLLTGLTVAVSGGYFLAQKPKLETKELPTETNTVLISNSVSCGSVQSLDGLSVALELPQNGTWSGRTSADGSVRIDVNESIRLPEDATARIVVDSVPPILARIVSPGASLGEVRFTRQGSTKKSERRKEVRDPLATRW